MRLMFVYWAFEDQGSGLLLQGYTQAARELGHQAAVYGRPNPRIPLNYSLDIDSADAVVFIFEWTTQLQNGDALDLVRLVSKVPRHRRVIIDGDGNYNNLLQVGNDYNHRDLKSNQEWIDICDSLTDKICQPTFHPLRENVLTFLFYCYNPAWERPQQANGRDFGMIYVGASKFRWGPMRRVLEAIEPVREQIGRIGLVGYGWDQLPPWASHMKMEDAYYTDPDYLRKLNVEALPPIPFSRVIESMSRAHINPVLTRPTFQHMRFVTPRFFETPAANTIPLFGLDEAYVAEIYGERGLELVLESRNPHEKPLDMLRRPDYYAGVVREVRRHLAEKHSQRARLEELIRIIES